MDALTLFAACAIAQAAPASCDLKPSQLLPVPSEYHAEQPHPCFVRWQKFVAEASRRFAIPQSWICAVMRLESAGRATLDGAPITSRAGAMGLMQLMPDTYRAMRDRYGLGADPYAPRDNILAGAAYLREMYDRYGYPDLFAAYNAGPSRLDAYLSGMQPLPAATRAYVDAIMLGFVAERPMQHANASTLFFALHGAQTLSPPLPETRPTDQSNARSLFVSVPGNE